MIKKTIQGNVPILIWTNDIQEEAEQQLINTATLPIVYHHVAAMADAHWGMGATIGSVIATRNAIIPAAVGVDVGCGMIAIKTKLDPDLVTKKTSEIRSMIEGVIPVGFSSNSTILPSVNTWDGWSTWDSLTYANTKLRQRAQAQLGSLGGGNHFIEICLDDNDQPNVWIMLHSGSRGVGNIMAKQHIDNAKSISDTYMISLPDRNLAYLPEKTEAFDNYMTDLIWLQSYAWQNRLEMMDRICKILANVFGLDYLEVDETIHCHHNYAEREHHFGKNVWVTRKGAVRARKNDMGIIPGSMGTKSYIVKGLGNTDSFHSCSHGAGRRMSRKQAKKQFTIEDLKSQTAGVNCRIDKDVIDEIPSSYKDIDKVMANQTDLVEIVTELKQIVCIKG